MRRARSNPEKVHSIIGYDYMTIRVTGGRINKGLLAVPVSLTHVFPDRKQKIKVYFDGDKNYSELNFTPYTDSSRECRIGGMRKWFRLHGIRNNDELVLQIIDRDKYIFRLTSEKRHVRMIRSFQRGLDSAQDEAGLSAKIKKLAVTANVSQRDVLENEFVRLTKRHESDRDALAVPEQEKNASVSRSIRKILGEIYQGRCQLSGFTFMQKNHRPYFEIHHINESKGDYLQNLLVVSPNIHAQFTFANKIEYFDDDGWLRRVKFNSDEFHVFQFIDRINRRNFIKEIHG